MLQLSKTKLILCVLTLCCLPVFAQSEATEAAQKSAESWLALVDAGKYGESWDEAGTAFKSQLSRQQWEAALKKVHAQLGKTQSRQLKNAKYTTELPNAPNGEYVIIQYAASVEKLGSAIETVTPMKEEDGSWRVSGYHIRPPR